MIATSLAAFAIAFAVIALVRRTPLARALADQPNERSLHENPTPRVGGLGLMAGALGVAAWHGGAVLGGIAMAAGLVSLVSVVDDARSLPVALRLACHGLGAVAVAVLVPPEAASPAARLALGFAVALAIVWMANLFNFMDGADGLAGLMAAMGFGALAVAASRADAMPIAILAGALASASLAFLAFNFPPARVFMGDAGSVPLGFLAAALGWAGVREGAWPAWFPLLVFSPFIVDATVTLARRVAGGENFWRAHRSHYYQRLVLGGWSHRRLALASAALMAAAGASALAALWAPVMLQRGILVSWVIAYAAGLAGIDRRYPRKPA